MKTPSRLASIAAALFLAVAGSVAVANAAPAAPVKPAAASDAFRQMRNAAFTQCVDAPGGVLNVRLRLAPCSTLATRRWVFVPTGAPNTFFIVNRASGFCMEVNNGTATPGETVDEFTCDGLTSEQWVVEGLSLRHLGTNQCLDTVGGAGSELMQFTCGQAAPAGAQSWVIE
ncbi:RICIN domain-containing protein [Kutzneria chonburiensis]|uniref:RICIN domain-containing protein n=1 Tax=Kutzneria chonburiensis TaxID=1483604 RepID=A0ABV6N8U7_9PSEU|nr:RICIN domain-containing protein [Kutzneria chonburiensis]